MKINIREIMELLPHRYPFLLIDKVLEFKINESIVGIKNVTFNEPQFTGHFPTEPIMPGVLIVEAMAQLSAILVSKSINSTKDKEVFFMSIEEAKFRKIVEPGDTLHIYAKIEQNRSSVWKFSSNAKVNDQIVAESKFTAMVKNRN
ncbi:MULTISPECIES: 3-hydroxyacyl-ACP dehydratase FabZ [unclassified Candidatus Tisiphia]|uniref:3-hydroxyacyl-ACP dehydratase FabZ n=1 Tax=unclassified Candidatus Tisiphia TaxID=2996318 RepID=UPI00312CA1D2